MALAMLIRRFEFSMDPEAPPVNMTTVSAHYGCCYVYTCRRVVFLKDMLMSDWHN